MNKRTYSGWGRAGVSAMLAAGLSLAAIAPSFAQTYVSADFTGQTLPTGWSNIDNGSGGQVWEFNNPDSRIITGGSPGFDADFAILDSDNYGFGGSQDASLQTDTFDVSSATGAIFLSFDNSYRYCCSSVGDVDVWDGTTWTNVLSLTSSDGYPDPANHKLIDITAACNASSTVVVRFHYTGSWAYWWAIDNVEIKNVTCTSPSNLVASSLTASAVTVSWNAATTTVNNGYQYYYSTSTTAPTASTSPSGSTTDTFANVTGLSSNTTYYAWARSLCSSTDTSDWSSSMLTFTTLCGLDTATWTDDVEGQSGTGSNSLVDPCWTATPNSTSSYAWNVSGTGTTPSSSTGPDAAYSGSKFFFTEASSGSQGDTAKLISPEVVISGLVTPALEFYYHMYGAAMGNMYIQASDDGGATWSTVDSLIGQQQTSGSDPWSQHLISLSGYTGTISVRFLGIRGSSFTGDMAIDNISVREMPNCFPPSSISLAASNVLTTTATVSWGAVSPIPGSGYAYYYSTNSTDPTSTTTALGTTTDTFVDLTGLTSNTQYYFWVRSLCSSSDSSDWTSSINFRTECSVDTAPWSYDVEAQTGTSSNSLVDPCWTATPNAISSGYAWNVSGTGSTSSSSTGPDVAHSGTKFFFTEASYGSQGDSAFLVSPEVYISGLTTAGVEFYYHMYGSTMGNLYIQVSDNGGSSWTTLDSLIGQQQTSGPDAWLQRLVSLSGYSGTVSIRFVGIRGSSFYGDMSIDDISIIEMPTCFAPSSTSLTVTGVASSSATVSWASASPAPGSGYAYYYSTTNTAPSDTTASMGSTTDTFLNMTLLSPNTQYYFWVRSLCSSTDSSEWTSVAGFKTLCLADNLPYDAPIQAATPPAVPDCMTTELLNSNGTNWVSANSFGSYGFTGNYLRCVYTNFGEGAVNSWIFTNQLSLQAGTAYKVSFRYGNNSTSYIEKLAVAIGGSPTSGSMGSPIFDNTNISMNGSVDTVVYFTVPTTGAYSIGFHAHSDEDQYYLLLSDISVDTLPECQMPDTLNVGNITTNSASLSWAGGAQDYLIEYGASGFSLGSGTQVTATSSPYQLANLDPNATYDFYVKSICHPGVDSSSWSSVKSFTTLCDTPVVSLGNDTAFCVGSSMTLHSGSTDPNATFLWNDGSTADSLVITAFGNYNVSVTNQFGCSASDSISVIQGTQPTVSLGSDTGFCSGLSVTLYSGNTDTGATTHWSNGATTDSIIVSSSGNYYATVTNQSGCTTSDSVDITVYAIPIVGLGNDTSFCEGAALTIYTNNVDTSATTLWSDGSTGESLVVTTTGDYYVTVTSQHDCSASDSISINVFPNPVVNLGSDTSICEGQSLILMAGDATTTNLWSNGATGDSLMVNTSGNYFVTVTSSHNCSSADSVIVTVNPQPLVVGITGTIIGDCTYKFTATGVQNVTSYDWDFGDGSAHSNQVEPVHAYTSSGTYWAILTVANTCGSDSSTVSVECIPSGIHQLDLDNNQLQLYPNPASNLVMLKNKSSYQMESVVVYNVLGQIVYQGKTANSSMDQLDVSSYASGMYNVKIILSNGSWVQRKFEIRK